MPLQRADLFAKTNPAGNVRYYALYASSSSRRITLYYQAGGARHALHFAYLLGDGQLHDVLLVVKAGAASLSVDGVLLAQQALAGVVQDCGPASGTPNSAPRRIPGAGPLPAMSSRSCATCCTNHSPANVDLVCVNLHARMSCCRLVFVLRRTALFLQRRGLPVHRAHL